MVTPFLYSGDLIDSIQRQIDEPFFSFEISHGGADRNFGRKLFPIGFQTLRSKIYFCLHFNGNDPLTCINNKINLAGASVIGVVINLQILDGFQLLTTIEDLEVY